LSSGSGARVARFWRLLELLGQKADNEREKTDNDWDREQHPEDDDRNSLISLIQRNLPCFQTSILLKSSEAVPGFP
jgi:hypothetical protein